MLLGIKDSSGLGNNAEEIERLRRLYSVTGDLTIESIDAFSDSAFSGLNEIGGRLSIVNTQLISLASLPRTIRLSALIVENNSRLESMGNRQFRGVEGGVRFTNNPRLCRDEIGSFSPFDVNIEFENNCTE